MLCPIQVASCFRNGSSAAFRWRRGHGCRSPARASAGARWSTRVNAPGRVLLTVGAVRSQDDRQAPVDRWRSMPRAAQPVLRELVVRGPQSRTALAPEARPVGGESDPADQAAHGGRAGGGTRRGPRPVSGRPTRPLGGVADGVCFPGVTITSYGSMVPHRSAGLRGGPRVRTTPGLRPGLRHCPDRRARNRPGHSTWRSTTRVMHRRTRTQVRGRFPCLVVLMRARGCAPAVRDDVGWPAAGRWTRVLGSRWSIPSISPASSRARAQPLPVPGRPDAAAGRGDRRRGHGAVGKSAAPSALLRGCGGALPAGGEGGGAAAAGRPTRSAKPTAGAPDDCG